MNFITQCYKIISKLHISTNNDASASQTVKVRNVHDVYVAPYSVAIKINELTLTGREQNCLAFCMIDAG